MARRAARQPAAAARPASGFTLVELMISVALVLILMLAISWIFGQTTTTISTGLAAADVGREHRGSWRTLRNDFESMIPASQQPGIIIFSDVIPAFLNKAEKDADLDFPTANDQASAIAATVSRDLNGNNSEADAGESPGVYSVGGRLHRTDRISFYATNNSPPFIRKTAEDGTLIDPDLTSAEAWIWYGLLAQATDADGDGLVEYTPPGVSDTSPAATPNVFLAPDRYLNGYAQQWALGRVVTLLVDPATTPTPTGVIAAATSPTGVVPLAENSPADTARPNAPAPPPYGTGSWLIQQSRFDVALTTATNMKSRIDAMAPAAWWPPFNYAFEAKSFVRPAPTGPIRSAEAARTVPWFLPGCAQFIVEFAGDFYQQGTETFAQNVIDYDEIGTPPVRRIRWYGRPRDGDGDGDVDDEDDTIPILPAPWGFAHLGSNTRWDTGTFGPGIGPEPGAPVSLASEGPVGTTYVAAFRGEHRKPAMIRLTIQLVDQNGRLQEGQTIEHILRVP